MNEEKRKRVLSIAFSFACFVFLAYVFTVGFPGVSQAATPDSAYDNYEPRNVTGDSTEPIVPPQPPVVNETASQDEETVRVITSSPSVARSLGYSYVSVDVVGDVGESDTTIRVTDDDSPVVGADVFVNGEYAGKTGNSGEYTVEHSSSGFVTITVETGSSVGGIAIDFPDSE